MSCRINKLIKKLEDTLKELNGRCICKEEDKRRYGFEIGDRVQYTDAYCLQFDKDYHRTSVFKIINVKDFGMIHLNNGHSLHYSLLKHYDGAYLPYNWEEIQYIVDCFIIGNNEETIERLKVATAITAIRVIKRIKFHYPSQLDRFLELMESAKI